MSEKKYLSYEGLQTYHSQIIEKINDSKQTSNISITVDEENKTLKVTTNSNQ